MIRAEVDFYRVVGGGLNEFVETCAFETKTKTGLMKQIRDVKKLLSSRCKYRTSGDKIYYKIVYKAGI